MKFKFIWIIVLILLVLPLSSSAFKENEQLDLSTGEPFTDIGIPIPSFVLNIEPETAESLKYFFGLKQIGDNNFRVKTIRLYIIIISFMLFVSWRLSTPIRVSK